MGSVQLDVEGGICIVRLLSVEHVHLHLVVVALKENIIRVNVWSTVESCIVVYTGGWRWKIRNAVIMNRVMVALISYTVGSKYHSSERYMHVLIVTHLRRECQHVSSDTFYCCASCASFWCCSRCCCSDFCGSWGRCPSWSGRGRCTGRQSSCGPCSSGSLQTSAQRAHARTSSPPWNLGGGIEEGRLDGLWLKDGQHY